MADSVSPYATGVVSAPDPIRVGDPAPATVHDLTVRRGDTSLARGLVRTARPKQWAKNVLVFAAPAAAGVLASTATVGRALLAFAAFCLAASGTYYLNDVRDVTADRAHPRKRSRPVAAGIVSLPLARGIGLGLLVGSVVFGGMTLGVGFAFVVAVYVTLTTVYTTWFKHVAIVDIAAISLGFVLRAVAGGVAASVPLSNWFLIVVSFGALFLASGKRFAEYVRVGDAAAVHRASLADYNAPFLRHVTFASMTVAIVAYCLWAFEHSFIADPFLTTSVLPFVLALLRYALILESGEGEAPEDVLLADRPMQIMGLAWAVLFLVGVYGG